MAHRHGLDKMRGKALLRLRVHSPPCFHGMGNQDSDLSGIAKPFGTNSYTGHISPHSRQW